MSPLDRSEARQRYFTQTALFVMLIVLVVVAAPASGGSREQFDIGVFARVPAPPGQPEGIAVRNNRARAVFVGTSPKDASGSDGKPPAELLIYDRRGTLKRSITIRGQDRDNPFYGVYGMAFDSERRVYVLDSAPPRVIKITTRPNRQHDYAAFPDVPPCSLGGGGECSAATGNRAPFPNATAFAGDGSMYVTDLAQALIWRVPPGGGSPEVWFTHRGLEAAFGPNGIALMPDGRTLLFALTSSSTPGSNSLPAGLYTLQIQENGEPGPLEPFWTARSSDAPDGFAIGRSGRIYVALAGPTSADGLVVISPQGEEIARVSSDPDDEIPFDAPASVAFLGRRALITNHAFISKNPDHFAVLDVFAGERGLPLVYPHIRIEPPRRGNAAGSSLARG